MFIRSLTLLLALAGASPAATLGEAGYVVKSFCYQDSPRRAHSIAAHMNQWRKMLSPSAAATP